MITESTLYNDNDLNIRLLKSWVAAYKNIASLQHELFMQDEYLQRWFNEAEKLRQALFISRDEDTQRILDKIWEKVII